MEQKPAGIDELKRDEIIARVLSANTQSQCKGAERLIIAWMQDHPRDFGMLDAGEQLAMRSEHYNRPAEENALALVE